MTELLIVVGVIVVVVAIMLPVSASLIRAADLVKCCSNLKNIGVAATAYSVDHQGDWPYYIYNMSPPQPTNAQDIGGSQALITLASEQWNGIGKLWELGYLENWDIFFCPADKGPDKNARFSKDWTNPKGQWIGGSYAMRGYKQFTAGYFKEGNNSVKLRNIGSYVMGTCTFLRSPPGRSEISWHKGVYPVLFGDGTVAKVPAPDAISDVNNPPVTWGNQALQRTIWFQFDAQR